MASLNKGVHVEAAAKIARGFDAIPEDLPPSPAVEPVVVVPVVSPVTVADPPVVSVPTVSVESVSATGTEETSDHLTNQSTINSTINSTIEPSNKQTINQTKKRSSKPSDKQANSQSITKASKQTDKQTNRKSIEQPIQQSIQQADPQPHQQSVQQSAQQLPQQSREPVLIRSDAVRWLPLTKNQGEIVLFLFEQGGGLTNMDLIMHSTGIAYGTARSALDAIIREGFVLNKQRFVGHAFRGFSYNLNHEMCDQYASRVRATQPEHQQSPRQSVQQSINQTLRQSLPQMVQQPTRQTIEQSNNQVDKPIEEVSFIENLTSSKTFVGGIELTGPELRWWTTQGLTTAKTAEWLRQFADQGLTAQDLTQSLRYAWFDAAINQIQPGGKPIDRPLNWFFSFLPGGYARPGNYRTHQQLQLEREQAELDEMEQQAQQLAEIRRKKRKAALELQFQQLLAGEGEEYEILLAAVNSFEREMGGDVLENAMRLKFLEQHGVQG